MSTAQLQADHAAAELLVALLRAHLDTAAPPAAEAVERADWTRVERIAEAHGVAPFLDPVLALFADRVPVPVRERFALHGIGNRMRNRVVAELVEALDASCAAAGISVMLLKGAALLFRLYGEAGPRRLGDIDILVRGDALAAATDALAATGFRPLPDAGEHFFRRSMHTVFARQDVGSIAIELHWDLSEPYRPYAFALGAIWGAALPLGTAWQALRVMSPEHELAHLCLHLERHALLYRMLLERDDWFEVVMREGTGSRLLWLYDVALCVRRWGAALDWDALVDCAQRWAIAPHVHAALEICRRVFLTAPPADAMQRLRGSRPGIVESLTCRVLLAAPRPTPGAGAELPAPYRAATVIVNVWTFLTPSAAYLRQRYGAHTPALFLRLRHFAAGAARVGKAVAWVLRRGVGRREGLASSASAHPPGCARGPVQPGYPRVRPDLLAERIDSWLAIYDPGRDAMHRLNAPAARVLALCDGTRTVEQIAAQIREDLALPAAFDEADVGATIDRLSARGLLTGSAGETCA